MSIVASIGAVLAVLILNVLPSTMPMVQLNGEVHLFYVLLTLFVGVMVYSALNNTGHR